MFGVSPRLSLCLYVCLAFHLCVSCLSAFCLVIWWSWCRSVVFVVTGGVKECHAWCFVFHCPGLVFALCSECPDSPNVVCDIPGLYLRIWLFILVYFVGWNKNGEKIHSKFFFYVVRHSFIDILLRLPCGALRVVCFSQSCFVRWVTCVPSSPYSCCASTTLGILSIRKSSCILISVALAWYVTSWCTPPPTPRGGIFPLRPSLPASLLPHLPMLSHLLSSPSFASNQQWITKLPSTNVVWNFP